MAYLALWLDHKEARIFKFEPEQVEVKHLPNTHYAGSHTHQRTDDKTEHLKKFYKDVLVGVTGATEILLMGPGTAKTEFKHYLEDHHQEKLAQKIVGVEPCDKVSDSEVKKIAQKYFHKHNLFN